jgi:Holliday junction resolvasome RuvABC endonuclease subunit
MECDICHISSGVVVAPKSMDWDDVIFWVLDQIGMVASVADVIVIESGFVGPSRGTAIKLAEMRGAFKCYGKMREIDVVCFAPGEAKKTVAGKGNASKSEMINAIKALPIIAFTG